MIVAITGSTGLIGYELIKAHIDRGDEVIAIIRENSPHRGRIPVSDKLTVVECNADNYESFDMQMRCDVFYHMSWSKTAVSGRDDISTQLANVQYSLDAVKLAHRWGAKKFIGTGSQAEYGLSPEALTSKTSIEPKNAYGVCKYAAGRLCAIMCQQLGIEFNWTRILSAYGEYDRENTLINYVIDSLLTGVSPELTGCEQIWDYIYSKDVASALMAIADKGVNGKTYVIGNGEGRPLREYIDTISKLIDPSIPIGYGKKLYSPNQVMTLYSDNTELRNDTGFKPCVSFEEGIQRIIDHKKKSM